MATVELSADSSVKAQSLVRLHPDGVARSVEADLKGKWGYRSTQINNTATSNQIITSDNDGNSYWYLLGGPNGQSNTIFIADQVYTVPNDNNALIFSTDINGKVRWVVPILSTGPIFLLDIKYDGRDMIVFVGYTDPGATVNFGSFSATLAGGDNTLFIAAVTVDGTPVVLESLSQPGDLLNTTLALDLLDDVTTAYVTGNLSIVAVRLTTPTQVFPLQAIPPLFTFGFPSGYSIAADGQGYLYVYTQSPIAQALTLLDGRTVTVPAESPAILIYPLQQQSPGIVVGPNGAPAAVWVITPSPAFFIFFSTIICVEERVYLSFSSLGNSEFTGGPAQISINGTAIGTSGTVNAEVGTQLITSYIVAMPRGISSFVDEQVGPFPLAVYSSEYPVVNTSVAPFLTLVSITGDNHGNIYAFFHGTETIPIRAGRQTVNYPCILRLDKDLSVISSRAISGSLLTTQQSNNANITANTRGDIWFAFNTGFAYPIVYDNLYLSSPSNTAGLVIIHATIDRTVELLGYTECVDHRKAKVRWPAVAIPKSIGYPGQEVGVTDDGRFAVSSATSKVMDPALTTHGLSTGKEVLLTPLSNE